MSFKETDELILRSVFDKYDRENKGYLNKNQFALFLSRLSNHVPELKGLEYTEAIATFKLFDCDSDDQLSYQEFKEWWLNKHKYQYFTGDISKLLKKAYELYSKYTKDNQYMTYLEFEKMMTDLNLPHSEYDFDLLNINGKGILSFQEFVNWLNWF